MNSNILCSSCGQPGHILQSNRNCPNNPRYRTHEPNDANLNNTSSSSSMQIINTVITLPRCSSCHRLGHQRSTHRECPNNARNRTNTAPMSNTNAASTSIAIITVNTDTQEIPIICDSCQQEGHLNNLDRRCPNRNSSNRTCICGSNTHLRTTHRDCPLRDITTTACMCGSTTHQSTTHTDCPLRNASSTTCICGSTTHQRTSHRDCPCYTPSVATCSCGSTTHQRTTHRDCPLNPNQREDPHNIARQSLILPEPHYFGAMSHRCVYCGAMMWLKERTAGPVTRPEFQMCCAIGKHLIAPLRDTPTYIQALLQTDNFESREFKKNIRAYNSALSFTSLGVDLDTSVQNSRGGAYSFRIHGSLYHRIGSLLPEPGEQPKFAQIYIYDSDLENQLSYRSSVMQNIDRNTLSMLQDLMHGLPNPYVLSFKNMMLRLAENPTEPNIRFVFQANGNPDNRRYNAPATNEIAVLMLGTGNPESDYHTHVRDIIIYPRNGNRLQRISEQNQNYDALGYAVMFPHGEDGWNPDLKSLSRPLPGDRCLTARQFYSNRLQYRNNDNSLHLYGKLFHQYIVDMYAKVEQDRMRYFRNNQYSLRVDLYTGLLDAMNSNDRNLQAVGRRVILPSTFIGGPRHMLQLFYDAINMVRRYGKPDYFITFTCNPSWREIQDELLYGQTAADRPDLCARVFHIKLKEFMNDITKNAVLGKVDAYIKVVEFQKRGLPHAHMLFTMTPDDKPMTTNDIDNAISAELPDPIMHPQAYETVTRHMIHGPCGGLNPNAPCMKDGICSKKYPKRYAESTSDSSSGYPVYKRRNNGQTFRRNNNIELDNRWVVPHNIYLCTKYNAHINVEICNNLSVVKYLYKYVYKGHDRARLALIQNRTSTDNTTTNQPEEPIDEIKKFIDARYVAAPEAIWRIFAFSLHQESPPHQRLAIHLPDEHLVYYEAHESIEQVVDRAQRGRTTLTQWMAKNQTDSRAREHLYIEFPEHYVWENKQWIDRTGFNKGTIGRIYSVSPRETEKYHLRMMLLHIKGATSFEDLRTVDGVLYPTFQQAAEALGLIEDDNIWIACMQEGCSSQMPHSLRCLFVTILVFNSPNNPFDIWNRFKDHLADDHLRKQRELLNQDQELTPDMINQAYDNCLLDINDLLDVHRLSLTNYAHFTMPLNDTRYINMPMPIDEPRIIAEQRILCQQAQSGPDPSLLPFNHDQRLIFDQVILATQENRRTTAPFNNIFFVDGPGGTGKTYLFNAILDAVRRTGEIALAVAASGAAAILLKGGRTAHSRFSIPLKTSPTSTCSYTGQSATAQLIRLARIVIWDEASMISRNMVNTVDLSLRDTMFGVDPALANVPFGGKIFVFGGDFRQVLPVIPRGSRSEIVEQCLNQSTLWQYVQRLTLRDNMRVTQQQMNSNSYIDNPLNDFPGYLLNIGNGVIPSVGNSEYIRLPDSFVIPDGDYSSLASSVYNNFAGETDRSAESLGSRAILAPTNAKVNEINDYMLQQFSTETGITYQSVDTIDDEEQALLFPVEFLNSINHSSLPSSRLCLKVGVIVVLLRNIAPTDGLCNGTRLICKELLPHLIVAEIATGPRTGNTVFIPRIQLIADEEQTGVEFKRRQFPIRLAFAMTINKAQGQTLNKVGLYLKEPVFSHGQLYVAMSRVRRPEDIKIVLSTANSLIQGWQGHFTANVVYPEVLN